MEQIKQKIIDYMLSVDLAKLPSYDLVPYINAYKALEGSYPFPGFGLGMATLYSDDTTSK